MSDGRIFEDFFVNLQFKVTSYQMKRLSAIAAAALFLPAAFATDIDITPGGLEKALSGLPASETSVAIKGAADARDLSLLRSLPKEVKVLDLSGLRIQEFTHSRPEYFNKTYFQEGEIPAYCFFSTGYSEVKLPSGVKSMGTGTFAGSKITTAVIPEGVTEIGDYLFYDCPDLEKVTIPSSLSRIGKFAFANCPKLKSVDLSDTKVNEIPEGCFSGSSSLSEVLLPTSLERVGKEAFRATDIKEMDLSGVAKFDDYALSGMHSLIKMTLNPNATYGQGVLMDSNSLLSLSGTPEDIPSHFLANSTSFDPRLTISGARTVGDYAFANNSAVELLLSSGLTSLDKGVVYGMNGISRIEAEDLDDRIPAVDDDTFSGINCRDVELHVSDSSFNQWKEHPVWGMFNVVSDSNTSAVAAGVTNGIVCRLNGKILEISAPDNIKTVDIYSLDGRLLLSQAPDSNTASVSVESMSDEMAIVRIVSEKESKTVKILIP